MQRILEGRSQRRVLLAAFVAAAVLGIGVGTAAAAINNRTEAASHQESCPPNLLHGYWCGDDPQPIPSALLSSTTMAPVVVAPPADVPPVVEAGPTVVTSDPASTAEATAPPATVVAKSASMGSASAAATPQADIGTACSITRNADGTTTSVGC